MLRFVVEKQYMRAYGEQAYDGTINYFSASFEFSPEWDGRDKYAIFTPEAGNAYIAHLVDDKIQQEVGFDLPAGKYKVTVYGDTIEGTEATGRITAGKPTICIDPIEFMNGEPLPPVPPTIAEQIAANAESARRIAQSVRDDADSGVFDGVSPEVITEEIEDGTRITIIDRDGEHTFELHNGENAVDHNLLTNRGDPNAHPISAITGLEHELELKQDVIGDLEEIRERARMVLDKADRSEIPTGTSDLVNDAGFLTNATVPVKSVNGKTGDVNITPGDIGIGTVFELKGSVQRKGQLPYSGNKVGDVWYVIDESVGYIWLNDGYGPRWEQLGPSIDLSAYALKSEVPTKISDLPQDPQHETVTYEQKQRWSAKQDAISDLSTIRSNAQKASTAVQPHDLATVATTGSYNDLTNQPEVVHPSDLATVATTGSYNDLTDKPTVFGNEVEVGSTPEDADLWIDTSESGSNVDPSVRWDVQQSLTDAQKERARNNIGATGGGVSDVQVNGTSIVVDGVANVPVASAATAGVVKINQSLGVNINAGGELLAVQASNSDIDARSTSVRAIGTANLDYAVKSAMCDGNGVAWTATEQAAARERIGAYPGGAWNVETITLTTTSRINLDIGRHAETLHGRITIPGGTSTDASGGYISLSGINADGSVAYHNLAWHGGNSTGKCRFGISAGMTYGTTFATSDFGTVLTNLYSDNTETIVAAKAVISSDVFPAGTRITVYYR